MRTALITLLLSTGSVAGCGEIELNESAWAALDGQTFYGVANFDDDDSNGSIDWEDALVDGENDLLTIPIDALFSELAEGDHLTVALEGGSVRVWKSGVLLLTDGDSTRLETGTDLMIEFTDFLARGTLTITRTDDAGEVLAEAVISLMSGPLILNNHSQIAELAMAMSYSGFGNNNEFISEFSEALGDDHFRAVPVADYGWDVWVQDEIEMATLTAPDHRMDVVIDSIRTTNGSGLDDFPEEQLEAPDFARHTWGDQRASSQDSFGNMEASPPVTVDGVYYPFGRLYWGEWNGSAARDETLLSFLEEQKVQAPFQLDVSWLCVGHVDEFITFVPDATSDKGFRMLITDVDLGYEFLDSLDPEMSLPQYESSKGYATIGSILEDDALRMLNEDIQVDYLDPALETLKAELALVDDDIIKIPMLFEENSYCGGTTATFFPGAVNMTIVQTEEDGEIHAFLPDPFLREDTSTSDSARAEDPFIQNFESLLPASLTPHWLDDWDVYHMMLGEVHCGSNTVRAPNDNWWESALHLLGE